MLTGKQRIHYSIEGPHSSANVVHV